MVGGRECLWVLRSTDVNVDVGQLTSSIQADVHVHFQVDFGRDPGTAHGMPGVATQRGSWTAGRRKCLCVGTDVNVKCGKS